METRHSGKVAVTKLYINELPLKIKTLHLMPARLRARSIAQRKDLSRIQQEET